MRRRAVTMAELMVVMIIIVILAAVLLPAFLRGKKAAVSGVCISNMRQLYSAMKLYEADFGEYPPNSVTYPAFTPYYRVVLHCPLSKHKTEPNLRKLDYEMLGSVVPIGFADPNLREALRAFQECRDRRLSQIPVVIDRNHVLSLLLQSDRESRFLITRDDGSFDSILAATARERPEICDSKLISFEYNY